MRKRISVGIVLFASFLVTPSLFAQANALGSTDQLQQLTAQLQQSPGDQALREKIIALALTINPRPATPDAATMSEGAAEYAFKNAKATTDFSDAAKQYEKALLLAPWLAADYFNCGVAHEKAGENQEAIHSFSLYLMAAPNADDALAVKKRIGGLQYAAQKGQEQSDAAARQAQVQSDAAARQEAVYRGLDGGEWVLKQTFLDNVLTHMSTERIHARTTIEVHGHEIEYYYSDDLNARSMMDVRIAFTSRQFQTPSQSSNDSASTYTISEDGQTITIEYVQQGTKCRYVYERAN